jgi:hypothetical protein
MWIKLWISVWIAEESDVPSGVREMGWNSCFGLAVIDVVGVKLREGWQICVRLSISTMGDEERLVSGVYANGAQM